MFQSLFEKWVERATRLLRSATRRPERRNATLQKGRPHWLEPLLPFRPAGRRTAQAGRLCYRTTGFQTRSQQLQGEFRKLVFVGASPTRGSISISDWRLRIADLAGRLIFNLQS